MVNIMSFVITEFSKAPKHYSISQKIEDAAGLTWKEVATVKQRSTAFFLISLIEKLSR
jgi:hypothetical protein